MIVVVPRAFHDPAVGWFPPDILPRSLSLTSWREVLADRQIPPSAVLGLVVSSIVAGPPPAFPTARALARFDFPLKRAVEPLILAPYPERNEAPPRARRKARTASRRCGRNVRG